MPVDCSLCKDDDVQSWASNATLKKEHIQLVSQTYKLAGITRGLVGNILM